MFRSLNKKICALDRQRMTSTVKCLWDLRNSFHRMMQSRIDHGTHWAVMENDVEVNLGNSLARVRSDSDLKDGARTLAALEKFALLFGRCVRENNRRIFVKPANPTTKS